jgi:MHS family proline/betaine transporter-like MFS transporter
MNKKKLILSSTIATIFEWYDYALFGHFAPIIGEKYFPNSDPNASLLQAFLIFAIGYLMRPIGGIFFGIIGDKFGRKTALSSAVICMAFPTAAIGFLPTYETFGVLATTSMIMVRMLQGLSMGGALTGSVSFVIEHTEKKHRGLAASFTMSGICIGLLLGSVVSYITKISLSPEQFDNWGWRVPFLIGIFIFFAGVYIKKYTHETPLFEDVKNHGKIVKSPLKVAFKYNWFDMLISTLINCTGSVIFYIEAIYLVTFLKVNRGFDDYEVSILNNSCYIVMAIITVLTGWLSDKIGRRKIFVINLVAIIIVIPILIEILETGSFLTVVVAQVVIAILAAGYIGPEPALQAEFYPTNIRNTALSVSYNVGTSVFGGTAPYIIESLVQSTGTLTSSVYYILACSLISLAALYFYKDRSALEYNISSSAE